MRHHEPYTPRLEHPLLLRQVNAIRPAPPNTGHGHGPHEAEGASTMPDGTRDIPSGLLIREPRAHIGAEDDETPNTMRRGKRGFLLLQRRGNSTERAFEANAKHQGYRVLHTGWPDYLAWRERPDGTIEARLIEVKSHNGKLTPEQEWMRKILFLAFGISVEISHGECTDLTSPRDKSDGWQT